MRAGSPGTCAVTRGPLFLLNLVLGLACAGVAVRLSVSIGMEPLEPAMALWLPPAAFLGVCVGRRAGSPRWQRWLAALLNLGCMLLLGSFACVAATGLFGFLPLLPILAFGAAVAAWNTISLIRRR